MQGSIHFFLFFLPWLGIVALTSSLIGLGHESVRNNNMCVRINECVFSPVRYYAYVFRIGVTQCKPTCSEISIFPLRVATAATANQVCAGSAFAKKYAQEFARVASAISEIFQCVTRHLQETGISGKYVFGGAANAPDGTLKTYGGTVLPANQEAYVVCEYNKVCSKFMISFSWNSTPTLN